MPVSEYPFVLTKRLGDDGYAALVDMAEDREGQLTASMDRQFSGLREELDRRFGGIDQRFAKLGQELVELDQRMNVRFEMQTERTERRILEQCGQLREAIGGLRIEMVQQRADLSKWAMVFWISQAAAVAGIVGVMR
jgi:hypothetical protein